MDSGHLKKKLVSLREELLSIEKAGDEAARPVELDQSRVGRLSRMDAMQSQAMSAEAKRRRENKIRLVDAALKRIEAGGYGLCLECDEEIAAKRLEFDPSVILCIDCANRRER